MQDTIPLGVTYEEYLDGLVVEASERIYTPWVRYVPNPGMQELFRKAPQRLRALFPGNRAGKTTAMAVEANGQAQEPGSIILWICPQYKQFDALRPQIEGEVFGPGPSYNEQDNFYKWDNKSKMYVIPRERDWSFVQGINPDLVCVDEECPLPLWRELRARGAGTRNTRYIVAATATNMAGSWMEKEIYRVWLDFHLERGVDERQAMRRQLHPEIFCWPRGGIGDNLAMTAAKVAYFKGLTWGSDKEKKVRDEGGFETSVGDPVFDPDGVEWLRQRLLQLDQELGQGRRGFFEVMEKHDAVEAEGAGIRGKD